MCLRVSNAKVRDNIILKKIMNFKINERKKTRSIWLNKKKKRIFLMTKGGLLFLIKILCFFFFKQGEEDIKSNDDFQFLLLFFKI